MPTMAVAPEMTVSYEADAYDADEISRLEARLCPLVSLSLDPVRLPHSAGTCELWTTLTFASPAIVRGALSADIHDTLSAICAELGDWWRECAPSRVIEPEVVAVHLDFADLRIAFDSECAQGSYLGRAEIRAIPGLLRDVAHRLASLVSSDAPPSIRVGIRKDVTASEVAQCFAGRYWQIGHSDRDHDVIYDSWREWFYRRCG